VAYKNAATDARPAPPVAIRPAIARKTNGSRSPHSNQSALQARRTQSTTPASDLPKSGKVGTRAPCSASASPRDRSGNSRPHREKSAVARGSVRTRVRRRRSPKDWCPPRPYPPWPRYQPPRHLPVQSTTRPMPLRGANCLTRQRQTAAGSPTQILPRDSDPLQPTWPAGPESKPPWVSNTVKTRSPRVPKIIRQKSPPILSNIKDLGLLLQGQWPHDPFAPHIHCRGQHPFQVPGGTAQQAGARIPNTHPSRVSPPPPQADPRSYPIYRGSLHSIESSPNG